MRFIVVKVLFWSISFYSLGQFHRKESQNGLIILSPGVAIQGQLFGELNLMYSKYTEGHGIIAVWGPRLGIEMNMNTNHFIYAPKIGYEVSGFPLILRGSLVANIVDGKT